MESENFRGLITMDRNLIYQQNIKSSFVRLFILCAKNNSLKTLAPYVQEFERLYEKLSDRKVIEIELP
jgi:fatty acid-binding protein DegV